MKLAKPFCIFLFIIFFLACNKVEKNNVLVEIGGGSSLAFYLDQPFDRTHSRYPADYGYGPIEDCEMFFIDTTEYVYFTICYYPYSDTILDNPDLQRLNSNLFNQLHFNPQTTEVNEQISFEKNGIYNGLIKYKYNNTFNSAIYKYYKNKLVFINFYNFNSYEKIDIIAESFTFTKTKY